MSARRRWLPAGVVAALVLLLTGRWLAVATTQELWADAAGAAASLGAIARLRLLLLATAVTAALLWCLGNLYLVYRSIGSVHVPRRLGNIEILEAVPRRQLLLLALGLGAVLAVLLAHRAGAWWSVRALAGAAQPLGVRDPVLDRDLAFYLFTLPWHRTLHRFAIMLSGVLLALVALLYAALGAVRWSERRLRVTELARAHLGGLLGAFALTLVWGYQLEPAEYVAGVHAVPLDRVLTDVRIPATRVLTGLALVAGAGSLVWVWTARAALVTVAWGLLAGASFVGHYVAPAFAAATRAPDELTLAAVEEARVAFTTHAFGPAPRTTVLRAPVVAPREEWPRAADRLARAPLWDTFALTVHLDRRAEGKGEAFHPVTLAVRRAPDGAAVPLYLGVRRVAREALPDSVRTWEAVHMGSAAAARGVVAVLGHQVTADGLPLFVGDPQRPDAAQADLVPLGRDRPRTIVAPGIEEFLVVPPAGEPVAGAPVGGLGRRLALAWALQSPRLLSASAVPRGSRIVWERDVVGRLERLAPFARFGAPYPALAGDRLYWIADGYAAAEAFPLAPRVRWRERWIRSLGHGLIGVVDAASGRATVYLTDRPDPVSAAWARLAPDIVRPADEFPADLEPHLRYPAEAFAARLELVHAERFPDGSAFPALRPEPVRPGQWWLGPVPGDTVERLRLLAPLVAGEPGALRGFLVGWRDGMAETLALLRLDAAGEPPVPADVARELAELPMDSAAARGAVRLVPVTDGVLAYQAVYRDGSPPGSQGAPGPPRLVGVAVQVGGVQAMGPTLVEALRRAGQASGVQAVPIGLWREAGLWFERLDAARRAGDWQAFGRAYEALRRLLATPPEAAR